jgi:2-polyprenyl-3-methyl-5-hydroxy-6-metoxy-1,4-benzoquinol methylase
MSTPNDFHPRLSVAERLCMKFATLFPKEASRARPSGEGPVRRNFDNSLGGFTARFPNFLEAIRDAAVLDYGCAMGHQCIGLSQKGARSVVGIDIQQRRIDAGRELLRELNLDDRISLHTAVTPDMHGMFDAVVSLNCVEHFPDPLGSLTEMKAALKPGGRMFVTFGPVWYSAYGPHQHEFTRAPWLHLLFSESVVMKVRGIMMNDQGTRTYSQRWLNQMTVKKFERLVPALDMTLEYSNYDCSMGLSVLGKVPGVRELAVNNIACVFRKRGQPLH